MIGCIRLRSGPDGKSHFEEGAIDLEPGQRGDILFTEDTIAGHAGRLYAILDQATAVPFRPVEPRSAAAGPKSRKALEETEPGAGP